MDIFSGDKSEDSVLHGPFSHPNALFDLLQLLRTANFWIQATQRDFHKRKAELVSQELRDQRLGDTAWPGINLMEQNWERVEDALEKKSAKLVRMIDRKTEEIQILREGVCHHFSCFLKNTTNDIRSSSTQRRYEKPHVEQKSMSICLCSHV